jgi:uncharacterized membrane protein YoaK (UPF0700 family)
MTTFFADIRDTIAPRSGSAHGPLSPVLVSMTVVTGLVDAFSYLVLGHVFVANMTGNIVFLGFALAGAPGFSIGASAVALVAFGAGAVAGGRLAARYSGHRGRLHSSAAAAQALFLTAALVLAVITTSPVPAGYRYALITGLGISMGIQNAAARRIAVPDLTTTVLTLTITGIAADSALAGGGSSQLGRRLVPILSMLAGGLVGAALVLHAEIYYPLAIALAAVLAGGIATRQLGKADPAWTRPQASPPGRAQGPRP